MVVGIGAVGLWAAHSQRQPLSAGFWFEPLPADVLDGLSARLGAALTAQDLESIDSVARRELEVAFGRSRLRVSAARGSMYTVAVVGNMNAAPYLKPGNALPIAGGSRSLPGLRGNGAVSFATVASNAIAYAPAGSVRQELIQAIGRGIGRTAVHEFAHQILGSFLMDDTTDRLSYEFADLRTEHFFGVLHWGIAAKRLHERIGLAPGPP